MTTYKMPDLKYMVENELFITCPFLQTNRFIQYCKDRDISTSRKQLEQFERLGIFYPIARVQYPKIKYKVKYIDDGKRYLVLGRLKDEEDWNGDVREEYAHFWFEKGYAMNWLKAKLLWKPLSRPFQSWDTLGDKNGYQKIESFYSIFQCYPLHTLIELLGIESRMDSQSKPNRALCPRV
ncbi:MAG: hypothetical protein WBA22_04440 [Candidatus Methanofastidiosia archaeon]